MDRAGRGIAGTVEYETIDAEEICELS
jgi:hypothetical protein